MTFAEFSLVRWAGKTCLLFGRRKYSRPILPHQSLFLSNFCRKNFDCSSLFWKIPVKYRFVIFTFLTPKYCMNALLSLKHRFRFLSILLCFVVTQYSYRTKSCTTKKGQMRKVELQPKDSGSFDAPKYTSLLNF